MKKGIVAYHAKRAASPIMKKGTVAYHVKQTLWPIMPKEKHGLSC